MTEINKLTANIDSTPLKCFITTKLAECDNPPN